jgi:hypothetical protein
MTAQTHDRVNLQGTEYSLVGVDGSQLFEPENFGFKPTGRVTNCARGFVCHYILADNTLVLNKLQMSYGHLGRTKFTHKRCFEINGVAPIYTKDRDAHFNNVYESLNLKIEYTGRILIADGFISKLYVHMGFHPAWKYQTIYELTFDDGTMTNVQDVSQTMKDIREEMIKRPLEPGRDASYMESARWVNSTFSLIYSHKNGEYKLNIGKEPEEDLSGLSLSESLESLGRLPDDLDEPDDD